MLKDPDGNLLSLTQFANQSGKKETNNEETDENQMAASEAGQAAIWSRKTSSPRFKAAFPISGDIEALPVKDLGPAIAYYTRVLGFQVESREGERAVLRRDDARIGIAKSAADPEQASCYFSVENLAALHSELTAAGVEPSEMSPSEHGGRALTIFFAKEPYGVCFCFGEPRP